MPDQPDASPADEPQADASKPDESATETALEESGSTALEQDEIEVLLNKTEAAVESLGEADNSVRDEQAPEPYVLEELTTSDESQPPLSLDLLRDVDLNLQIELGRTHMIIEDVLRLRRGSVVALDKLAGDPVDIYANGYLIARGEVLVLNENFCVRITEIVSSTANLAAH